MKSLLILGLAAVTAAAQAQVLYDNGPVVQNDGLSILQPPSSTLGLGIQVGANNFAADNFVVGGLGWDVTALSFYAYQTGATSFTFTGATWSIVAGDVNNGTVVASGTSGVTNGGLRGYRVTPTTLTNTQRPIYQIDVDVADFTLAPGGYWLRWSLAGSLASGPWQPLTSDGTEGDLHQATGAGGGIFNLWTDTGSGLTGEAPFTIHGVAVVPEPGTYALMLLGLAGVAGWARRRRNG